MDYDQHMRKPDSGSLCVFVATDPQWVQGYNPHIWDFVSQARTALVLADHQKNTVDQQWLKCFDHVTYISAIQNEVGDASFDIELLRDTLQAIYAEQAPSRACVFAEESTVFDVVSQATEGSPFVMTYDPSKIFLIHQKESLRNYLSVFDIKMPRYCCGLDWRSYASIVEEVGALFYLKPCFGETKKCILIGTPEDYQIFLTEHKGYVAHYFAEECVLGDVYQVDSVSYEQELVASVTSERLFSDLHCLAGKPCASVALLPYDARLKSIRACHRRLMAALKVVGPMQATYLWVDERIVLQNVSYGQQSCPDTHVFRAVVGMDPSSVYLGLQSGVLAKEGIVNSQTATGFHLRIPSQPGVFQSLQLPFEQDSYEVLSVMETGTVCQPDYSRFQSVADIKVSAESHEQLYQMFWQLRGMKSLALFEA